MKDLRKPQTIADIRSRIARLTADDTRLWGVMQPVEMVCHLRESFVLALGERDAAPAKPPVALPPQILKFLALRVVPHWRPGVETVPELKREAMPPPGDFALELTRLGEALDRFLVATNHRARHPFFGPMQPTDWMRWGYLHADLHLRQFGR